MNDLDQTNLSFLSEIERIKILERIYISSPNLNQTKEKITYCHQYSKLAAEVECLLITGQTGAGKTTLCKAYAQQYPRQITKELIKIPVLSTAIPVPATVKSLATKLLIALGDPLAEKGSTVNQTLRLIRFIKECYVELIILDEFQHFIDRDSNHILLTVANWLKDLLNETNVPMVVVGMPYSDIILRSNSQLERRFSVQQQLNPFGWETLAQQNEFRTFLYKLDELLPFSQRSNLASYEMALRIYSATSGVTGYIMKLIRRAGVLALTKHSPMIDLDLLAYAYQERFSARCSQQLNPFSSDIAKIKISLPQEKDLINTRKLDSKKLKVF